MILADKIIRLRKKNGWSQEELADKMQVSRQAVSKWESAQSIPDLEKILQLGTLFGVTTDYLLKDEIEDEEFTDDADSTVRTISIEEANTYLALRRRASRQIALATFLCILSPITLILLGALSEVPRYGISETVASVVGLIVLFAFVLCAVPIFIYCGFQNQPYEFLEKDVPFSLAYGVRGLVTERMKKFRSIYVRSNIIATCICIFSPIPLIVSAFAENDLLCVAMLAVLMVLAGIGACTFIVVGVQNASMQKLLQEGDFTKEAKHANAVEDVVGFSYWGIVVALFLIPTLMTNDWAHTWVIFPIAAILFPIVLCICKSFTGKHKKD